jgi:hypothetical protein
MVTDLPSTHTLDSYQMISPNTKLRPLNKLNSSTFNLLVAEICTLRFI